MTKTVQELAAEMSQAFISKTRANGQEFRLLKDGSPDWMTDIIRAAHDDAGMLPDDWRYRFVEEACDALAECDDLDDLPDVEPDIYTADLTAWLASNVTRAEYLKQALDEMGIPDSGCQLLAWAQWREKQETLNAVLSALQNLADEQEAA